MQTFQEYAAAGMGIAFHAKNLPEKKAIVSEHGDRTFQELNENSNRYANFLLDKGLKSGEGVAIVCKNRPEFLEALFGPLRVGLRITPINWHLTPEEICYIVENCEAKVVVCDAIFSDFIEEINKQLPEVIVMSVDGEHPWLFLLIKQLPSMENQILAILLQVGLCYIHRALQEGLKEYLGRRILLLLRPNNLH